MDPDALETAAVGLLDLARHLSSRAHQVDAVPAPIPTPQWAGAGRRAIEAEITALRHRAARFAPLFTQAGETVKALAVTVRTAPHRAAGEVTSQG